MKVMQRRSRKRDEEEEEYFEKYQEPSMQVSPSHHTDPDDSTYNLASATAMMPARSDAYPDRALHYGTQPEQEHPTQYVAPEEYEYPPGTAYAAAAQSDGQYQYTRYQSPSPNGAHPFADPQNHARPQAAPPVSPGRTQSVDAYGGIESGYAQ